MTTRSRRGRPRQVLSTDDVRTIEAVRAELEEVELVLEEFQWLRVTQEALFAAHEGIEKAVEVRSRRKHAIPAPPTLPPEVIDLARESTRQVAGDLPPELTSAIVERLPSSVSEVDTKLREARLLVEWAQGFVFADVSLSAMSNGAPWPSEGPDGVLARLLRQKGFSETKIARALSPDLLDGDVTESKRKRAGRQRDAVHKATSNLRSNLLSHLADTRQALEQTLDENPHGSPQAKAALERLAKLRHDTEAIIRLTLLTLPMMPGVGPALEFRTPAWSSPSTKGGARRRGSRDTKE